MTEHRRPRGRPRSPETMNRDQRILTYLKQEGPQTRNLLAEVLGEEKSKVWLSLDRLRRAGQVAICRSRNGADALWTSEVNTPCPG